MAKHSNFIAALLLLACTAAVAAPDIRVNGLMPNQAVVTIDGKQRILKVGIPSPEGVSLIAADSQKATLEWQGERFVADTAGGGTPSYKIMLDSVSVGDITLRNITAAVIVADSSTDILLGMSFLEKTEMREENNVLVLRKKY